MTRLNTGFSSTPENPSELMVQGDKVIYKHFVAPTIAAQLKHLAQTNETNPQPRLQSIGRGASITSEKWNLISQGWDKINTLAFEYYNEASLQTILANWHGDNATIEGFSSMIFKDRNENVLKQRLYELIWEANPVLKERYDNFRLVADRPKIFGNEKIQKWIDVQNFIPGNFNLTVHHLDINGDWIKDNYKLSMDGKATYKDSLTKENYATMMDRTKDSGDKFAKSQGWGKGPARDVLEDAQRSLKLAQHYHREVSKGKMDNTDFYMTTPPEIYDPEHPEKGIQGTIQAYVRGLLDKNKDPDNN